MCVRGGGGGAQHHAIREHSVSIIHAYFQSVMIETARWMFRVIRQGIFKRMCGTEQIIFFFHLREVFLSDTSIANKISIHIPN